MQRWKGGGKKAAVVVRSQDGAQRGGRGRESWLSMTSSSKCIYICCLVSLGVDVSLSATRSMDHAVSYCKVPRQRCAQLCFTFSSIPPSRSECREAPQFERVASLSASVSVALLAERTRCSSFNIITTLPSHPCSSTIQHDRPCPHTFLFDGEHSFTQAAPH